MNVNWSLIGHCCVCLQSIKAKMEELRPLIPVLEAYKADTLLVKQFREEVANVTELLGTLQEQLGGLDYQDLHSRVLSLEDRLRACMQRLGKSTAVSPAVSPCWSERGCSTEPHHHMIT